MKVIKAPYKVKGGIHPAYHKDIAMDKPIEDMPIPPLLRLSAAQHIGAPATPIVKKGDKVLRGQVIAEPAGFVSAALHAPTSGEVKGIVEMPTGTGTMAQAIELEPDGEDAAAPHISIRDAWSEMSRDELVAAVANAGIVGMGGAGFPTHVKLSPPPDKGIDTLIINGAECEPYLTADHRIMVEHADQIWTGARMIAQILRAKAVRIAIEDNKPDAISAMKNATARAEGDVALVVLDTQYPQGAEKQQIYAITGREVPSGGLPMDVGALVENVGTALAIWDAIYNGTPLVRRVTTVAGAVNRPGNIRAPIGTRYADLVDFCGGAVGQVAKIISGGPMMGLARHSLDLATTKTSSGLLLLGREEASQFTPMPCISCGRCIQACPMHLMACEISLMLEAEDYESAEAYSVADCIECGCCAFVCPARRPLVQHMKQGKAQVMARKRMEKQKEAEQQKEAAALEKTDDG